MSDKKTKPDVWMPLYVSDYLADTMHLTATQHGAYLLLLMAAWKNGGALDNDKNQLASIAHLSQKEWRENERIIARFFFVTPEVWTHNRVKHELLRAEKNSEKRAESGKKGAAKRWQNVGKKIANAITNASQNDGPSPSPLLPTVELVNPACQERDFSQGGESSIGVIDATTGEVLAWAN